MPYFKKIRESITLAYCSNKIDNEEFVLLYDLHKSRNLDIPHTDFAKPDLENYNDDQCYANFRFSKAHVYKLRERLNIPEEILCYNNVPVDGVEALCTFLKRFSCPCRYVGMVPIFARPIPQLSITCSHVTDKVYSDWGHLLSTFNQPLLSPINLELYANAVHDKGAALGNCWGFVDGTVRALSRPNEFQRILYNGHKNVHALKFQSVVAPNGFITNLYGQVEGKLHDSGMLRMSGLLEQLKVHSFDRAGNILRIYGDPAHPLRPHLQAPFRGNNSTNDQIEWNKSMSAVRVSVEWIFGDIINSLNLWILKESLKIELSAAGKMYLVCGLLHKLHYIKQQHQTILTLTPIIRRVFYLKFVDG